MLGQTEFVPPTRTKQTEENYLQRAERLRDRNLRGRAERNRQLDIFLRATTLDDEMPDPDKAEQELAVFEAT